MAESTTLNGMSTVSRSSSIKSSSMKAKICLSESQDS